MKKMFVVMLMVTMSGVCLARTPIVVGGLGGSDGAGGFVGIHPDSNVPAEFGIATYRTDEKIVSVAVYAAYSVANNIDVPWAIPGVGSGSIKANAFVGGEVGGSWKQKASGGWEDSGATALLAGSYFGSGPVRIGLIGRLPVGGDNWNGGLSKEVLLAVSYTF